MSPSEAWIPAHIRDGIGVRLPRWYAGRALHRMNLVAVLHVHPERVIHVSTLSSTLHLLHSRNFVPRAIAVHTLSFQ